MGIGDGTEGARRVLTVVALTSALVALWSSMHHYKGVSGDAELYAVQAMARIHPWLVNDLFLQGTSQDEYTIFSPLYAWCIEGMGLGAAALTLAMICKVWLLAAAWMLVRSLTNTRAAFMAVALAIITVGTYGAFGVFHYAEDWLTARSLAEALVVSALAMHSSGLRVIGLLVGLAALFVHPLIGLPGLLVLVCLWCSLRFDLVAATVGVLATLGIALWAIHGPSIAGPLVVMDPDWTEVVRERSVFLFLQYWHARDWFSNLRPFLSLTISAMALNDTRVRKLCIVSMLVGATGLMVALIASTLGPVAILIQGQSWRWEWITCLVGVLLLAPAVAVIYRDTRCGPLCALLLIAGWTFLPVDGTCCVALALLLWLARKHTDSRAAAYLRWAAGGLGIIIAVWTVLNSWNVAGTSATDSGRAMLPILRIRSILGLQVPAVVVMALIFRWIVTTRSPAMLTLISLLLGSFTAWLLPLSLRDPQQDAAASEIFAFTDWRNAIPPASNVYVAPVHNSATFAWFTLERPSYLSVDQSAGVVFSRAVAMEVKRRSQVLLPMMPPDWQLLTAGKSVAVGGNRPDNSLAQPLTGARLISVCQDPKLGFVVAKEDIGFDRMWHHQKGDSKDWNLYNCARVRALAPAT